MAKPTYLLQIGFGTTPFATTDVWTDVSTDMQEFHTRRGRQHELDRMEAGVATFVLNNASHDYYPDNADGTYYPNVACMKKVNLQAVHGGGTYPIYTGYAQSWAPFWRGQLTVAPTIKLNCTDALRSFARFLVNGTTFPQQTSGTRVIGVLDKFGFPSADREIDAGQELIASLATSNTNALEHLQSIQDSELGLFYQLANGKVIYEDHLHRTLGSHGTAQAVFGDDAGENKYSAVDFSFEDTLIYNEIHANRSGGSEQIIPYADSIAKYGTRTLNQSDLLLPTDTAVKVHALRVGSRYADVTKSRVKSITIAAGRDETNLYPIVLGCEISTRIGVRLNQAAIDSEYFIEGINHDWTAKSNELVTKWQLSEATQYLPTLGTVVEILRPNTGGDVNFWTPLGVPGSNWQDVDEVICDNDTTYVATGADGAQDLYNLPSPGYPSGTINSITLHCVNRALWAGATVSIAPQIKTEGTIYVGSTATFTSTYSDAPNTWSLNPKRNDAWAWNDLIDLQAGIRAITATHVTGNGARCTQVFMDINFTPTW